MEAQAPPDWMEWWYQPVGLICHEGLVRRNDPLLIGPKAGSREAPIGRSLGLPFGMCGCGAARPFGHPASRSLLISRVAGADLACAASSSPGARLSPTLCVIREYM